MVLLIQARPEGEVPEASYRATGQAPAIVAYGPAGTVAAPNPRFVWGSVSGVASYRLTLTRLDGATVWSASTRDTLVALPDSIHLAAGQQYFWIADALLADGGVRTTGPREFQIEP